MSTNRNSEVTVTLHLTDGSTRVLRHRNSLVGWKNALERAGLTVDQVDHTTAGLPESDRVHPLQAAHDASRLAAG